jgi:hypothetical protein
VPVSRRCRRYRPSRIDFISRTRFRLATSTGKLVGSLANIFSIPGRLESVGRHGRVKRVRCMVLSSLEVPYLLEYKSSRRQDVHHLVDDTFADQFLVRALSFSLLGLSRE